MFFNRPKVEKHYHNHSSPMNTTVTENKAPTDESVRLLSEMQEKAMNSIVKAITVDTNTLKFKIVETADQADIAGFNKNIYILFNLNGEDYKIERTIDYGKFHQDTPGLVNYCMKVLSEEIADQVFSNFVEEVALLDWSGKAIRERAFWRK